MGQVGEREKPRSEMVQVIEAIVTAFGQLEAYRTAEHFHLRVENGSYMPLVIEAWDNPDDFGGQRRISIAHCFEQEGDLMADPDILIDETGEPYEITQAPVGVYQRVYLVREGQIMVNARLRVELKSFLAMWAKNLKVQGFIEASLRHYSFNSTLVRL